MSGPNPKDANGNYLVPGRLPPSHVAKERPYKAPASVKENQAILDRIEKRQQASEVDVWLPVQGATNRLVYKTREERRMDDFNADDMKHGKETREDIEGYGFMRPFKSDTRYSPTRDHPVVTEDPFNLPADVHFERMKGLGFYFSNSILGYETSGLFSKMVDKFERNEAGYYMHPFLDDALRDHDTTAVFHKALKQCLADNIKDGTLDDNIVSLSSEYLGSGSKGVSLPKFDSSLFSKDLYNGTVLTVHDIWAMRVYVEELEYKGDQIRGQFKYEIQDHFGLDNADIDSVGEEGNFPPYEWIEGFRSWYLLQHYKGYNYQPFITQIKFRL